MWSIIGRDRVELQKGFEPVASSRNKRFFNEHHGLFGSRTVAKKGQKPEDGESKLVQRYDSKEVSMKAVVFLLLLCVAAIAACGGDSSMDQQAQSAVMGSDPMTAPDGSMMTPTPMMQMTPSMMR
jgi:hypothetical protein